MATESVACSTPVPVKLTVCGLLLALSEITSALDLAPVADGVKVTLTVQEVFDASVAPQVVPDWTKSAEFVPLIAVEDIVTTAPVLLMRVTILAALVLPIP